MHIFDGVNASRIENSNVLVEDQFIAAVSREPIVAPNAMPIDVVGRTLTPGLIAPHRHIMAMETTNPVAAMLYESNCLNACKAITQGRKLLDQGTTAIRDVSGPSLELGQAIDAGYFDGPRIISTGHFIGETSGHRVFAGQRRIGPIEAFD